jgi:hypothetical protein
MKKILFFIVLLLEVPCLGNAYAYLTKITYDSAATQRAGKMPFTITIQSSDKEVKVALKNGESVGLNKNSLINPIEKLKNKGRVYSLNELNSFSFTIPWQGWDGDATVHVKVMRGNELISQMDLQDRNSTIKVIGVKNVVSENISKMRNRVICNMHYDAVRERNIDKCAKKDIDCSLNLELTVDPITGSLSVTKHNAYECDDADQHNRIHEE